MCFKKSKTHRINTRYKYACIHLRDIVYLRNGNSMKTFLLIFVLVISGSVFSQRGSRTPDTHIIYNGVNDARRMAKPPVYPFGQDSLVRFYFAHFSGFDTLLTKAIANGDTAKYLRVYFTFVIDRDGAPIEPHFTKVASTRYAKSEGSLAIKYFDEDKDYFEEAVKKMIFKMTFWKPGYANVRNTNVLVATDSRVEDYIQFWVGIDPPQN